MHISYSSIKDWKKCPHYFYLTRIEKLKGFTGNVYTAFGKAIHETCEFILKKTHDLEGKRNNSPAWNDSYNGFFKKSFYEEVKKLEDPVDKSTYQEFQAQGLEILPDIYPSLKNYFGNFKVISVEKELSCNIENKHDVEVDYKGYVDLILKAEDGFFHVIDWKSCSWGWNREKRSDTMQSYQLSYYKNYFSLVSGIPLGKIKTHFGLLKRTGKGNRSEIFEVKNGEKKISNALNLLENVVYNISSERYFKNRLSCRGCDFYKTENCL
tara:strand:+ start:15584 stop:16384 length:801 start_codon:yes stop_codon:yes gene_type:complete